MMAASPAAQILAQLASPLPLLGSGPSHPGIVTDILAVLEAPSPSPEAASASPEASSASHDRRLAVSSFMLLQAASPSPVAAEAAAAAVADASAANTALPAPSPHELLLADQIVQRAAAEGHTTPLAIVQAASMVLLSAAASPSPSASPSEMQLASLGAAALTDVPK
eukprot:scaffold70189_cov57-Phaeocystis_antarctica.AAC.5